MENNKMSAEEILRKYFPKPTTEAEGNDDKNIILMLNEYTSSLQKQIEESEEYISRLQDEIANAKRAWSDDLLDFKSQLSQKDEMTERMSEAFKFALGMKELWMTYTDSCAPEHEEEAIAIQSMHNKFIDCLTQYQNSKK